MKKKQQFVQRDKLYFVGVRLIIIHIRIFQLKGEYTLEQQHSFTMS